jgi:hypothetical protein
MKAHIGAVFACTHGSTQNCRADLDEIVCGIYVIGSCPKIDSSDTED